MNLGGTVRLNNQAVAIVVVGFTALYLIYSFNRGTKSTSKDVVDEKISVGELLCAAIAAAEAGGREVKAVREKTTELKEKSKGKTKEGVKDVLTDGDMRSHQIMFSTITSAFPQLKVISEEHDDSSILVSPIKVERQCPALDHISKVQWVPSDSITVWIDPLDATKEYTENLLQYVTTMVCVAVKGNPVIGVIHKPFEKKTFWAWVGHGISNELLEINGRVPDNDINDSFIISLSHTGNAVEDHIKSKYPNAKVVKAGGAGYKSLEVAARNQGAYVHETNIKKWDVCAGHAVMNALGGHITNLKDEPITYDYNEPILIEKGLLATLNINDYYSKLLN